MLERFQGFHSLKLIERPKCLKCLEGHSFTEVEGFEMFESCSVSKSREGVRVDRYSDVDVKRLPKNFPNSNDSGP